ncbi:hypothetical protein JCM8097_004306 [Rhodosporidiobolus ruineniae]
MSTSSTSGHTYAAPPASAYLPPPSSFSSHAGPSPAVRSFSTSAASAAPTGPIPLTRQDFPLLHSLLESSSYRETLAKHPELGRRPTSSRKKGGSYEPWELVGSGDDLEVVQDGLVGVVPTKVMRRQSVTAVPPVPPLPPLKTQHQPPLALGDPPAPPPTTYPYSAQSAQNHDLHISTSTLRLRQPEERSTTGFHTAVSQLKRMLTRRSKPRRAGQSKHSPTFSVGESSFSTIETSHSRAPSLFSSYSTSPLEPQLSEVEELAASPDSYEPSPPGSSSAGRAMQRRVSAISMLSARDAAPADYGSLPPSFRFTSTSSKRDDRPSLPRPYSPTPSNLPILRARSPPSAVDRAASRRAREQLLQLLREGPDPNSPAAALATPSLATLRRVSPSSKPPPSPATREKKGSALFSRLGRTGSTRRSAAPRDQFSQAVLPFSPYSGSRHRHPPPALHFVDRARAQSLEELVPQPWVIESVERPASVYATYEALSVRRSIDGRDGEEGEEKQVWRKWKGWVREKREG